MPGLTCLRLTRARNRYCGCSKRVCCPLHMVDRLCTSIGGHAAAATVAGDAARGVYRVCVQSAPNDLYLTSCWRIAKKSENEVHACRWMVAGQKTASCCQRVHTSTRLQRAYLLVAPCASSCPKPNTTQAGTDYTSPSH